MRRTDKQECGNCAFFKESGKLTGKCLRNPPTHVQGQQWGEFVGVRVTWWCGEYQDVDEE